MKKHNSDMPISTPRTRSAGAAGFLLVGLWVSSAQAMPNFPGEIQAHLQLSYTPQCTLCHATTSGGGALVTTFGKSMQTAGLTSDTSTLGTALDKLEADNTDSNGDGIADIQALRDGSDPNTGASQPNVPIEKYGCGARIATGLVRPSGAMTLAMALLGMVLSSRRRARQISR